MRSSDKNPNENPNALARLMDRLRKRLSFMVRRAVISLVNDDNAVQVLQLKFFEGECRNGIERLQEYGFSSVPPVEGQVLAACVDGECGHYVVIASDDRRYRPRKKGPGDVIIYTKANRKGDADTEHHIYLDAETREIVIRGKNIKLVADEDIDMIAGGDINLKAMGEMDAEAEGIFLN